MEWLKEFVKGLPLDSISEVLAKVVLWWIRLVEGIPDEELAIKTYVGGSLIALFLLYWALKLIPSFLRLRGIIWLVALAVLLTPGATINDSGGVAPAIIDVLHSLIMGDPARATMAFLPILTVIIAGLVIGAVWQMLKAVLSDRTPVAKEAIIVPATSQHTSHTDD